jgi:hypothetical protein
MSNQPFNNTDQQTRRNLCIDCGIDTTDEYYMVKDDVWPIGGDDGMLCIGCLENRLGRTLIVDDFIDALINDPRFWKMSSRMRDRLSRRRS